MVEAAMGVVGVEMEEAPGRVEEPATAAAAPPMPPLLRLMPLPLMLLPLTQRLRLTLPPLMRLPPIRLPWIIRPSTILP